MKLLGKIQIAFLILFLSAPAFAAQSRSQTGQIRAADSTELPAVPGSEPRIELEIYIFQIPQNRALDRAIQVCEEKADKKGEILLFKYSPAFNPQFKSLDPLGDYIFLAKASYAVECIINLIPKNTDYCTEKDELGQKVGEIRKLLLDATANLREAAPINEIAHQEVLESLNRAEQNVPKVCPKKKSQRFDEAAVEMPEFFGAGSAEN
jgi:hypothetical protein